MSLCEQYQELISRLADGDLSQKEERELSAHIETCPECAALYQAFSMISRHLAEELEDAPLDLRDNVMAEIRREEIRKRNRLPNILRVVMSAAACVAVVVGVYLGVALPRGNHLSTAAFDSKEIGQEVNFSITAERDSKDVLLPRPGNGEMQAWEPENAREAPQLSVDSAFTSAAEQTDGAVAENAAPAEAAGAPEADIQTEEETAETVQSAEPTVEAEAEVFELRDWSLSLLRTLLGGEASERSPEELEGCLLCRIRLTAEKDLPEVPVYELDGVLYYLDPAEGTLYRADLTPEELEQFLHS